MAISEKSRKILWGHSGNRCAICRQQLVVAATSDDAESVVGEECHIVSRKGQGPRYDPSVPEGLIDKLDNLILLCRVHHKMVDDQAETYTAERLRTLKKNHENWVSSRLSESDQTPPIRWRRIKGNIPSHLSRITTGHALLDVVGGACDGNFHNDEPQSEDEMKAISSFLQEAQDWGELAAEFEAGEKVEAEYRMSAMIRELEAVGFFVFGARELQRMEGGTSGPLAWPVAHLHVVRSTNPEIMIVDPSKHPGGTTGTDDV
jgi:HNH endonuclease